MRNAGCHYNLFSRKIYEYIFHFIVASKAYSVPTLHVLCTYLACAMYLSRMRYVPIAHALCTYRACAMHLSRMRYVLIAHTLCTYRACAMYLSRMRYVLIAHALCTYRACAMYLSRMRYALIAHALCTYRACAMYYLIYAKLRKIGPKWQWNRPFSAKKSPHKFSNTDPSNLIISWLTHFKQTFSRRN